MAFDSNNDSTTNFSTFFDVSFNDEFLPTEILKHETEEETPLNFCNDEPSIKSSVPESESSVVYDSSVVEESSFLGPRKAKFIILSDSDDSSPSASPKRKNSLKNDLIKDETFPKSKSSVQFKYADSTSSDDEVARLMRPRMTKTVVAESESESSIIQISDSDTYEFKSEHSEYETEFASYRSNKSDGSKNSVHSSQLSNTKTSVDMDKCSISSFEDSNTSVAVHSQPNKCDNRKIASLSELFGDSSSGSECDRHTSGPEDDVILIDSDEMPEYNVNILAAKRSISPVKQFPIESRYQVLETGELSIERLLQLQMEAERINKLREKAILEYEQHKKIQLSGIPSDLNDAIKLITSVKESERKAKELSERLAFLNKKIANKTLSKGAKTIFDNNLKLAKEESSSDNKGEKDIHNILANMALNHLPSTSTDISSFGKQALATHNKQSAMTTEALERMHQGLGVLENPNDVEVSGLKVDLLPHQKVALNWMAAREKQHHPCGGILADDMGLGKTLTTIALIVSSKQNSCKDQSSGINAPVSSDSSEDEGNENENYKSICEGGTLVICPASVMGQWENEIKNKVKSGLLSYVLHHGPKRDTREIRLSRYDVVLSTYTILQKSNKLNDYGPLLNIRWKRIVLDEAHIIRNHKTGTALSAYLLKGKHRWCLTGTPIQNKSLDLFSLLKFLKCRPFDELDVWKRWVDNKAAAGAHRLNCIVKSVLLQRTKAEIENLNLKSKTIDLVKIRLDSEEMNVYKKVAQLSGALFAQFIQQKAEKEDLFMHGAPTLKAGKPLTQQDNPFTNHPEMEKLFNEMISMGKGISSVEILVLLLRLRQLCCHPSLVTKMFDKEDLDKDDDLVESDGTDLDLVDKMMNVTISGDDEKGQDNDEPVSCFSQLKGNPVFKKERVSSKVRTVLDYLKDKVLTKTEDKALIISQFTSVLEIIENELPGLGVKYCSLTGKVKVSERGDIMEKFNTPLRGPRVMLLSLMAGGTGLNLVGANHLLFVDVHWNPQLENQAFDRVYRIGQKKDVFIYKFICEDTIEERILKLQEMKLKLAESILTGANKISSAKLTINDLKMLFEVKDT